MIQTHIADRAQGVSPHHNPLRILKTLLPSSIVKKYQENPTPQAEPDIRKATIAGTCFIQSAIDSKIQVQPYH